MSAQCAGEVGWRGGYDLKGGYTYREREIYIYICSPVGSIVQRRSSVSPACYYSSAPRNGDG